MLKLKQIFTLKRILISLISLFFILFFVVGCSFRLMDWRWYKFLRLVENESGIYVYDRKLYEEVDLLRKKNGGTYHFNLRLPDGSILYKGVLSNGYEIISSPSANEQDKITMRNSRIGEYNFIRYQYYDSSHKQHIIAKVKCFKYVYYG